MRKEFLNLLFLLVLFSSCEDHYFPAIDQIEGQLVVDALITNDPARSYVRLTATRSFYDPQTADATIDARGGTCRNRWKDL